MINLPHTPIPTNARFFDALIADVQTALKEHLTWLDYSFGQCQRVVEKVDSKEVHYPAVYIRDNQYQNVLPDQGLGNTSFFILHDPQLIEHNARSTVYSSATASLVVWLDLSKIGTSVSRDKEAAKEQILKVLTHKIYSERGSLRVLKMWERAENVYKEFSIKEVEVQHTTHPFFCVRFDVGLTVRNTCY